VHRGWENAPKTGPNSRPNPLGLFPSNPPCSHGNKKMGTESLNGSPIEPALSARLLGPSSTPENALSITLGVLLCLRQRPIRRQDAVHA